MNPQPNTREANLKSIYDLIIVGAGPAGLAASIYSSRYKLANIVIGKVLGGELSLAHDICNYPGFESISGTELASKWKEQAEKLGAKVFLKEVGKVEIVKQAEGTSTPDQDSPAVLPSGFKVYISDDEVYQSKSLIIATGSERKRLNIPGEKEYMGRGVSYCHVCDAPFFKDKTVTIIGGSDSAVSGAVHTAEYTKKIYLIYRGEELRAEAMWVEECKKLERQNRVEIIYKTNVLQVLGDNNKVTKVKLDKPYKGKDMLLTDGVFIEIGSVPGTTLVQPLGVKLDDTRHVVVNEEMETNIKGLFCAGDMVSKSAIFKQATWAIAQGARAAASAFKYLKKETAPQIRGI